MLGFVSKLYGSFVIAANLPGQLGVPYLPEERLRDLRDRRVRETVDYAARTVPYYQELFRTLGIDPREIRTAEDLERLPLIDKALLREDAQRFVSTSQRGRTAVPFDTTGSTGPPVTVFHDRRSMLANSAFNRRERAAMREILGEEAGRRTLYIGYSGATLSEVRTFLQRARFTPIRSRALQVSIAEPVQKVVQITNEYRPAIIASVGSYIEMLFRTVATRGLDMHCPRMVVYGSDTMSDGGRRLIEEHFGVAVYSSYQAVEAFKIGFYCRERRHFHLHADLTHVRVVDEAGRTLPNGQMGEVVISNLVNRGTVLLNYRLGDVASLLDGPCPCGRTLPLLSNLQGRSTSIIRLPGGEVMHPWAVDEVVRGWDEVIQYQMVQHAEDAIELRLVTANRAVFERVSQDVASEVGHVIGGPVTINPVYFEHLGPDRDGKFRYLVSLLEPTGHPA